jgi:hypothetical protein
MEKNNKVIYMDQNKAQTRFNGEYDPDILCQDCESLLGKLDGYYSRFSEGQFPNKIPPSLEKIDGKDFLVKENDPSYDYSLFKLFLLSLLWRASISVRPLFGQMKLDAIFEEDLRKRIFNSDPGSPQDYPCFIHLPPLTTAPDGTMGFNLFHMPTMSPRYLEKGSLKIAEFIIQGVHYYFIIERPLNWKVIPAIETNKLTLGFTSLEEQSKLIELMASYIKGYKK